MKPPRSVPYAFITLLLILLITNVSSSAQTPPPAPVLVDKVEERKVQKPVTLVGSVEPRKRSVVASAIEGLVKSMLVQEGDYVSKGDVIAKLVKHTIEINLNAARASKKEAQARYQLAEKNLIRIQQLQDKGVASIQRLQDAKSEKDSWDARVEQHQAQIENYEYALDKSSIKAPFNGYVTREYVEVGEWVQEGGPIIELIDIEMVEINVNLPERYVNKIKRRDKALIRFDALPKVSIEGTFTSLVPQADGESRTFPVKINVDNKNSIVKSGMVARVSFSIGKPLTAMMVHKDAIVPRNNANFIYVVNDGIAQPIPVTTGIELEEQIQVIGNIKAGQLVVIRGNERLMPNQPVKILNEKHETQDKAN